MTLPTATPLWRAVDDLLEHATVDGSLAHGLGPLAAHRLRGLGEPVPTPLERAEQLARMAVLTSIPLLRRIRDLTDGPLVLVKGAEIAWLYPGRARSFSDVDLLAVEADAAHEALTKAGFSEMDDQEIVDDYRHLPTLEAPRLWLNVEIHTKPIVPDGVRSPPLAEIVEASVPSALGVEGISAPHPVHHALMLAAHAWDDHEPLATLRDLIDVAAISWDADRGRARTHCPVMGDRGNLADDARRRPRRFSTKGHRRPPCDCSADISHTCASAQCSTTICSAGFIRTGSCRSTGLSWRSPETLRAGAAAGARRVLERQAAAREARTPSPRPVDVHPHTRAGAGTPEATETAIADRAHRTHFHRMDTGPLRP